MKLDSTNEIEVACRASRAYSQVRHAEAIRNRHRRREAIVAALAPLSFAALAVLLALSMRGV